MSDNEVTNSGPEEMQLTDRPEGQVQYSRPAPAPTTDSGPLPASAWDTAVGTWTKDHLRNSPLSGATEAWNHLMGALPKLKTLLEAELKKP